MSFWSPKTGFTVPHKRETERQAHTFLKTDLIAELDRAARKEGYGIVVFNCSMDYYWEQNGNNISGRIYELIRYDQLAAIVMLAGDLHDTQLQEEIIYHANISKIPVIWQGGTHRGCPAGMMHMPPNRRITTARCLLPFSAYRIIPRAMKPTEWLPPRKSSGRSATATRNGRIKPTGMKTAISVCGYCCNTALRYIYKMLKPGQTQICPGLILIFRGFGGCGRILHVCRHLIGAGHGRDHCRRVAGFRRFNTALLRAAL